MNVEVINNLKYIYKVKENYIKPYFDWLICTAVTSVLVQNQLLCHSDQNSTLNPGHLLSWRSARQAKEGEDTQVHTTGSSAAERMYNVCKWEENRIILKPTEKYASCVTYVTHVSHVNIAETSCTQKFCRWGFHHTSNHCTLQHMKSLSSTLKES